MNDHITNHHLLELVENPHVDRNLKGVLLKELRQRALRIKNDRKRGILLNRYLIAINKFNGTYDTPARRALMSDRRDDTDDEEDNKEIIHEEQVVLPEEPSTPTTSGKVPSKKMTENYQVKLKVSEYVDEEGENITEVSVLEYINPQPGTSKPSSGLRKMNKKLIKRNPLPYPMPSKKANGFRPGPQISTTSASTSASTPQALTG